MNPSRHLAALCLTCILFTGFSRAAETVLLKPNHQTGDTFTFDQGMSMQMNINASTGGQVVNQIQQDIKQARKGKLQVLEVQNGEVTKATITFDPSCGGTMGMNGQQQPVPFPLAGKTVTVTRQPNGSYQTDAQMDPQTENEIDGYVRIDAGMYPKNAVAVGDSWDIAPAELAKAMQMQPGAGSVAKGTLTKLSTVNGRQVADIDVKINFTGEQPGAGKMTISLTGSTQIDVATGRNTGGKLSGPLTLAGQQNEGGQVIDLQGTGQMSFNITGSVTGGGAVAANPNPAPVPDPMPNPVDPATPAVFKGTFNNDKLTLTLDSTGTSASGKIVMGTKEFDCTGSIKGNLLSGNFKSGTSEFPFTATLSGDAMTFKTGSSSYELKRKSTVKNPLE